MTKPDDSGLDPESLRAVEARARKLLYRANAFDRFPTPVEDILAAAKLRVAPTSAFDPARIASFIRDKTHDLQNKFKSALSKVLGIYDADEHLIHVDASVKESKQNFLTLHETGHHEIPTHRKIFRIFQDCEKTLDPHTADLFEREANNFARFALFQGDTFAKLAADCKFEIKTPMKLAGKFGASVYASAREFARSNTKSCVVFVLEPVEYTAIVGAKATVRRIEPSASFLAQFGKLTDSVITLDHMLGPVLPLNRKMTRPTTVLLNDLNGTPHECVAEAFDTSFNVLILLYPRIALTRATVILPASFSGVPRISTRPSA